MCPGKRRFREGWELKRTTHLVSGIAMGALVSSLTQGDLPLHIAIGAFFGVAPDLDLLLAGLARRAHRSPASHSLLASSGFALIWAVALLVLRDQAAFDFLSGFPVMSTASVAFLASFLHASEDSLTIQGTKLLYPFSRKTFRGPVRYDDHTANLILSILAVFAILLSIEVDLSRLV